MAQPNPKATFVQLESDFTIYRDLTNAGIIGFPDLPTLLQKLANLNDPLLKRLYYTIKIAGDKYATAQAEPLGYYACIAIHNSAIDANWDGGSDALPYGNPNTPA
jgi:hypothetical protein